MHSSASRCRANKDGPLGTAKPNVQANSRVGLRNTIYIYRTSLSLSLNKANENSEMWQVIE